MLRKKSEGAGIDESSLFYYKSFFMRKRDMINDIIKSNPGWQIFKIERLK